MKNPNRKTVVELEDLPNIGPAMARDLRLLNIKHPQQLIGNNAYHMHSKLCQLTGKVQDPCVIDVFLAAVHFMEGGESAPWWDFSKERKEYLSSKL